MNTSRHRLQTRLAPGFRRLRSSTTTSRSSTAVFVLEQASVSKQQASLITPERLSFCEDDLLDVEPNDILEADRIYRPQIDGQPSSVQPVEGTRSLLARSRSSLARIKSFSKPSRRSVPSQLFQTYVVQAIPSDPPPPTVPSGDLVDIRASTRQLDRIAVNEVAFNSDTSLGAERPIEIRPTGWRPVPAAKSIQEVIVDPNQITPSPPISCIPTPATLTPSSAVSSNQSSSFRRSLRRLRTFTKGSLSSFRNPAPEIHQVLPSSVVSPATNSEASSTRSSHLLPELSFDSTPLSILIQEGAHSLEAIPNPSPQLAHKDPRTTDFALRYEFVHPSELCASPADTLISRFSIVPTLLPPPPSWLSRDVQEPELLVRQNQPHLHIESSSPSPLHILLRNHQVPRSSFDSSSTTPRSTNSSLTLNISHNRLSLLSVRHQSRRSSLNRLSILRYRQSIADSRKSIQSFVTCASVVLSEDKIDVLKPVPEKPQFFLLLQPPSPAGPPIDITPLSVAESLSPLEVFDSTNPLLRLPSLGPQTSVGNSPSLAPVPASRAYQIFCPSQSPEDLDEPISLPPELVKLARTLVRNSVVSMSTYSGNKQADTVDFGDEADYSGYEWFKDPPVRPEPQPQVPNDTYVPQPVVIEQNDLFDYALKSAPNVLYSRFKQYGQLGVLAWCSEFGELIDALKHLGFEGNMFVSTRTQALQTCEEIMRLELHIEMQIILMYLSSQVARLRRFLDHDRVWEDYPKPNFPQDPELVRIGS